MLSEYEIRKGFGRNRTKEYFAVMRDGDSFGGVVAGPFETPDQCLLAIGALEPLYNRTLVVVGGHLVAFPLRGPWANLDSAVKELSTRELAPPLRSHGLTRSKGTGDR